jgi:hypothetical protein
MPDVRLAHLAKNIFGRDLNAVHGCDGDLRQRDDAVDGVYPRVAGA